MSQPLWTEERMFVDGQLCPADAVRIGGYKQSGIGREMGRAGFEEYLEIKSIAEKV
jgi:aldehyde dehydrogenase (NAD+)